MEAIIPTKIGMPTTKTVVQDQMDNDEELMRQLDWVDKLRGDVTIRITSYLRGQLVNTTKGHNLNFFGQNL